MDYLPAILVIGVGATLVADLWALLRRQLLGAPLPDWGLVGRWMGYMPRGRFRHDSIAAAPAIPGERAIGWTLHYAIGVAYAAALVLIVGDSWLRFPTPGPALAFGLVTVAAPFLLMQPGMGAGIAASRTPRPAAARMHSLVMHAVFGLGMYLSAIGIARLQ